MRRHGESDTKRRSALRADRAWMSDLPGLTPKAMRSGSDLGFFGGGGDAAGDAGAAALGEEIVALVVHQDERGEVLDLDLPHGLHAELGVFQHLDLLDVFLGEDGGGAAD